MTIEQLPRECSPILAALMESLIDQNAPDSVSAYTIFDAIWPEIQKYAAIQGRCCAELEVPSHPVQTHRVIHRSARCTQSVTMRAYEVYCHLYGEQKAMITGDCRGGFGVSELIAFLYAHTFPKSEWRERVSEAFRGMSQL